MNKKILVMVVALLVCSMMLTPFALAKPWNSPKKNAKFQTFDVTATFIIFDAIDGDHQYIPSSEKVNKLIISWDESFFTHELSVGENTYKLFDDFLYTGTATWIFYDPVFDEADEDKLFPTGWSDVHSKIDYMYNFSTVQNGIEGTLQMRYVHNKGTSNINSLAGTGDLQNVQIKATAWNNYTAPIFNVFHEGIVSGWPDIPPASPP